MDPVAESGVDTVTIAVLVLVHPLAAVPVTVYVVVETGINEIPFVTPPDHV